MSAKSVGDPQRILVRGVNWLGDAVMTTPALVSLRARFPDAHIALLTHEKLAGLWGADSAVDQVISFAAGETVFSVARRLRAERFDLALVLPNSPRSALEVFLARIPSRVGFARRGRLWLLTQAVPDAARGNGPMMTKLKLEVIRAGMGNGSPRIAPSYESSRHHTQDYLDLVSALGAEPATREPRLMVSSADRRHMRERLRGLSGSDTRAWIGLNAGAEYGAAKRWPAESFVGVATALQERTGAGFLLTGGGADRALTNEIARALEKRIMGVTVVNLAGETDLTELCAALSLCRVVLTNDTGPMHVAAAVGARVVVPFGSTSPELTGPGKPGSQRHRFVKADAFCSPCFLRECPIDFRCMKGITESRIADAAWELWGEDGEALEEGCES